MLRPVRLAFLGDLMIGRGVTRALRDHPPEWFLGDVLPILQHADGTFANLESPITASGDRWRQSWKMFHFRANPTAIRILECANIRFVCLANNHIMDFSESGLCDTIEALDACDIKHAGAGRNLHEAGAPVTVVLNGLTVGLIAATDNMRAFAAGPDRPGTNFIEFDANPAEIEWISRSVTALHEAGAGLIVLSAHWGPNMRRKPSRRFRRFAHAAIECGVDVIHGHSAHVVQAIEQHRNSVILYDTGNFVDDYWKFPFRRTVWSFVFLLHVGAGRLRRLELIPVRIHSSPLSLATGDTFRAINVHMKSLCRNAGTEVVETPGGLEIPIA